MQIYYCLGQIWHHIYLCILITNGLDWGFNSPNHSINHFWYTLVRCVEIRNQNPLGILMPPLVSMVSLTVMPSIFYSREDHDGHRRMHYNDVIMTTIASQITSLTIVYSTVYSGADQSKHQSSASLAFVWGIHRGPVNSPHKGPVTRKMFPFDDVIMVYSKNYTHGSRFVLFCHGLATHDFLHNFQCYFT